MALSFMIMQLDAIQMNLKLYKSQPCELFWKSVHAAVSSRFKTSQIDVPLPSIIWKLYV